jgi:hypothetical protein
VTVATTRTARVGDGVRGVGEVSMGFPIECRSEPTVRRVVGGRTVDRLEGSRYRY